MCEFSFHYSFVPGFIFLLLSKSFDIFTWLIIFRGKVLQNFVISFLDKYTTMLGFIFAYKLARSWAPRHVYAVVN